ncbi:MAG: hypothetical protein A2664_02710 [Candidatus Taylorbacteria bacterium RIFCSPHIGHO2_01_FULL_46_22b]|uniref:UDP-N-acetylmuramoyl-tripeptide--D-alanyl-D-alanine ligase n=1 Tax=Candidatus Taylorbacteria bacterium RIFCSPHIGHO2_01_FULL_46_22b TaxID=1802301 RepID=A0A1G2M438_9BACT|nr:MAG: hypothetical protein A2664_02710 [Candidatus Taylorbacteria bacterium RIFCSPHIGHO2_01_FULL_46_22b]
MLKQVFKKAVVIIITAQARWVLKKYCPRIVAVTGSVGKTSTKDAIYSVLSKRGFVRKSDKSFNSEIGVPLTILGLPNAWNNPLHWLANIWSGLLLVLVQTKYPEWLVLEVGADRPRDIRTIAKWLSPDIVVVTKFAPVPVHVEYFGSPEEVFNEKGELVRALKPDGTLILSTDETVLALKDRSRAQNLLTFGFFRGADVFGSKYKIEYEGARGHRHPSGVNFSITHKGESVVVQQRGALGKQLGQTALAAAAVGIARGIPLADIAAALSEHSGPAGRMKIIEGIQGSVIIDDTYNSSPVAVNEALEALSSLTAKGRKIAVLGDMLELGRFSTTEHRAVGTLVATRTDILVTVGVRARDIAFGALEAHLPASSILQFDDAREAGIAMKEMVAEGDVLLIKGSQGIRMERIVEMIMLHPEERGRLLVRQDQEWKSR